MSKKRATTTEMVARTRNKALSCSTPEQYGDDSPSRDSDSVYDSDTGSPVPFLCTQDGADGETDVVWNFYTPKSNVANSECKNSTPVRRKGKKMRPKVINKSISKQKPAKPSQKRIELFQELLELNRNVHDYISKNSQIIPEKPNSEEDIFSDNSDSSPKSVLRTSSTCLRRNVLSSKFNKGESEIGLESDDSMNECLLKASQLVEENVIEQKTNKRPSFSLSKLKNKKDLNMISDQDSMDAILSNIKLGSPSFATLKKSDTPKINNDSFDNLLENLNDSALEKLSQMPIKYESKKTPLTKESWNLKEMIVHDSSPVFSRHNSMPESPSAADANKPSTSSIGFGRYNSMPFNKSVIDKADSPIKCTPDEIEKKRKQAREKLLAKRLLPFTQQSTQETLPKQRKFSPTNPINPYAETTLESLPKQRKFSPRVSISKRINPYEEKKDITEQNHTSGNIKSIIEKKRQEALMRLRKRQQQNK